MASGLSWRKKTSPSPDAVHFLAKQHGIPVDYEKEEEQSGEAVAEQKHKESLLATLDILRPSLWTAFVCNYGGFTECPVLCLQPLAGRLLLRGRIRICPERQQRLPRFLSAERIERGTAV